MVFKLSLRSVVIGTIGTIFLVQIISLLLSQIFPSIPILKGGNAILLVILSIAVMALFVVGTNLDQLRRRESLIFVVITFGLAAAAYVYLPKQFPGLFSIAPEVSNVLRNTIGSIIGGIGG